VEPVTSEYQAAYVQISLFELRSMRYLQEMVESQLSEYEQQGLRLEAITWDRHAGQTLRFELSNRT
jgi:hypothetical protein